MSVGVSDHALMRFLERAGGLDVEGLRREVARSLERARLAAELMGQQTYTVKADKLVYVIVDGVCVTVMGETNGPKGVKIREDA